MPVGTRRRRSLSQPNAAATSAAKRALMVGLLALSTLGFSTSPSDGSGLAIEEPALTGEEAQPAGPEGTQPGVRTNERDPSLTSAATTTTPPTIATDSEEASRPEGDEVTTLVGDDAEEDSNEAPDGTYPETSGFFETVSPAAFPDLAHQRLLPWGDGFLHIWSPPPVGSERTCNIDQLWARFSTDGVEWTEFSDLEIPSRHFRPGLPLQQVTGYSSWDDYDCWANNFRYSVHVASDGERLAVASQWPRVDITWPGYTAEDLALLDQLLENPPSIYLSMTTDLASWETIEMPIPRPAGLHDSLQAAPRLVDLSLDDQGWLLELETARFMNLLSLMPDDIRESAIEARPKHDGPWYDESSGEGMTVEWRTDGTSYGSFPYTRFVSWDELGTTSELYYEYGAVAMKPYLQPWHYSGSIFAASWGQSPTRFELPWYADGIVRTESGYVGLSDHSLAGYDPSRFGPAVIGFSSDGETWDELGPIAGPETWIRSIHAVNAGVLAFSSPAAGHEGPAAAGGWGSTMGDDPNPANGVIYWLGDPDGSNWQPIEIPEGATLIEWLMANDRAPLDWPRMAVNGDIVLRFADDGSIQRYVVPGTDEAAAVVKPKQSEGDTEVVQRFTAVSVGVDHSCGLYTDGTVDCWGLNVERQAEAPRGQFRTVVAGVSGSCGLRTDGSIECWGVPGVSGSPGGRFASLADGSGRPWCAVRGDGSVVCWGSSEAGVADVPSGPFVDVAVGGSHACGRRTDITIECWGDNSDGQADAPGGRFVSVTAGSTHSCGLTLNDRIVCWGDEDHRVADAPDGWFSAVDAGLGYSCGVNRADRDGTMECWGIWDLSVPAGRFTAVSVGAIHFCGVRVDGVVVCWGSLLQAADTPDGVRFVGSGRDAATPPEQSGDATEVTVSQPAVGFSAVGAGYAHSCGLRADGTIDCWGWGGSGQFLAPDGQFSAVAVGVDDSCGLRPDGTIECWGSRREFRAPDGRFSAVAVGDYELCGLRPDGTIECWGARRLGQADAPDGRFSAVAVGGSHSCGLRTDGTVVCWGRRQEGQLDAPSGRFAAVAAGYVHSCGLRADGSVVCWGGNHADPPAGQFDSLVAGRNHSCGLRTDGTAECWGDNRGGQADAPGGRFVSLAAGRHHSCGVRPDGTIDCWGTPPVVGAPGGVQIVRVDDVAEVAQSAMPFSAIAVGGWHSCGLRADGTIACWGWNFAGQVNAPEGEFVAVTVGGWHSCGLRADRTVECWGWNGSGQVDPPGGRFVAVAAGAVHSCGLRADGTVECWGDKSRGQGDVPDAHLSAVTVGGWHSCGLRADGTVACWGGNGSGQADPPAGRFSAVAAGGWHSCGLRADGTVVCWGSNRDGQADAPDGRFSAVTAGGSHSCGVRADGGIVCWGSDKYGLSRSHGGQFTAVAAGEASSCGLRPEGTVECWGRPPSPQARQAPGAVRFVG